MLAWLVAYQVALAQAAPQAAFDLRHVEAAAEAADTIVVTGRRRRNQRLPPLPDTAEASLPRLQTRLFGDARLGSDVEADELGMPSARIKLSIPF